MFCGHKNSSKKIRAKRNKEKILIVKINKMIEHLEHHLQNDMIDMKVNMIFGQAIEPAPVMFDTFQNF